MTDEPAVLLQQAAVWQEAGDVQRAEAAYRRVLVLDPTNADALGLLGVIHHGHGQHEQAITLLRAAIKLRPAARHWHNLGMALNAVGDRVAGLSAFRQAIALNPTNPVSWPAVMFAQDLSPWVTPEIRLADRRAFNARHCAALTAAAPPHTNDHDPSRRLRIGYISADFNRHSASMVFSRVLEGHDHEQVEVFCYWQREGEPDDITERFQSYADHWLDVQELDDDALAQKIRDDGIDILVDLSGYSNGNRLLMLARKPAPILMTGWGHVTGLGIDAADYILADATSAPVEHQLLYHERILRLPCVVSFDPHLDDLPPVTPPPAEQNEYLTFGYLGRASKASEIVWSTWAKILHRVPNSRLLLKSADYEQEAYRARVTDFFLSLRISTHRLEFHGASSHAHHLRAHAEVDVILDPFPQGGGVTTLEACLMGVPSVAMLGDYLNARIAPSVLEVVDDGAGVATTIDEYVEQAVLMADAGQCLADRLSLRKALQQSILMDAHAYAGAVEEQYRLAWTAWCSAHRQEAAA